MRLAVTSVTGPTRNTALSFQPGINVVSALAAPRLLDDHGDEPQALHLRIVLSPVHVCISSSKLTCLSVTFAFARAV